MDFLQTFLHDKCFSDMGNEKNICSMTNVFSDMGNEKNICLGKKFEGNPKLRSIV